MSSGTEAGKLSRWGLALVAVAGLVVPSHADDEKAAKQLEKLDAQFVKALTDLAKTYDEKKIPEAAHFFASCALGFGGKNEKLALIKGGWEGSVYLGKLRGGDPIKETGPITGALGSHSTAYRKILDPWIARARKNDLPESSRKLMLNTGVKYEIARGAHEYVQAVQRYNVLRKAMGLRALLWDFEASRILILANWYICETEDWELKKRLKESPFYWPELNELASAAGGPNKLKELPDVLRSFALVRQHLLNPNARALQLGYWEGGSQIDYFSLYGIPQLLYRDDIPTPTQRFRTETVVQGWVDTEDTVLVAGKKVPYARYPYSSEPDAPAFFSNGRGASETGWAESEHDLRDHAGVPIMVRFFAQLKVADIEVKLTDKAGKEHPYRVYVTGDKRVNLGTDWTTILILPTAQLAGTTTYQVTMKCQLDESPIECSWQFTTRAK